MKVKNRELTNDALEVINKIVSMDMNASQAFKLSRILKELSTIVNLKVEQEKKVYNKWVERDEEGNPKQAKDENGKIIEGTVKIKDMEKFNKEMGELMDIENDIPFEKMKFDDLGIDGNVSPKDIIAIDFLFE